MLWRISGKFGDKLEDTKKNKKIEKKIIFFFGEPGSAGSVAFFYY